MLSYRHAFHAGNFADVLKHSLLCFVLDYLRQKEKGFLYLDTHAGSGRYSLQDAKALKVGEFRAGIGRLWHSQLGLPAPLQRYLDCVKDFNPNGRLGYYPGSPAIAATLLRPQDRAELFELHARDARDLAELFNTRKNLRVHQADGFAGLKAHLPPPTRRGLVLMDPSYEIKSDYDKVVDALALAHKRFAGGIFMLWYPVVQRAWVQRLERRVTALGIAETLQIECCITADTDTSGMTGSGMLILNPPWTLQPQWQAVLEAMTALLGEPDAYATLRLLVPAPGPENAGASQPAARKNVKMRPLR